MGAVGTIGSVAEAHRDVSRAAQRPRNMQRGYALFRMSLGMDIFMHGFARILTGVGLFVAQTEKPFVHTIIPMPVVHSFLKVLPFFEFAIGGLLILGLFTMEASITGAAIMIILIFGMGSRQEWANVGNEMVYAAWYFVLIAFNENNWLCMDRLRTKAC